MKTKKENILTFNPEFNIGDDVYFMNYNNISSGTISEIKITIRSIHGAATHHYHGKESQREHFFEYTVCRDCEK
jgi:hypothetical protein